MAKKKQKSLVIVESPAKAKTINKYLGADYEVLASKGHVRDLPKSRFGIDIENGWVPVYRPLKDRKELLEQLKKHATQAHTVYLAPDPDREGEAIAWHLKESLKLSDEKARRVTFNEITKSAVQKAFQNAGSINMDLVAAQEARRFLDRVVGYKLSPLLSNRLAQQLSAGRVQSVAVRLIVDREREILAFKPEEYWKITALVQTLGGAAGKASVKATKASKPAKAKKVKAPPTEETPEESKPEQEPLPEGAFYAELADYDGQKFKASNQEEADRIYQALKDAPYVVGKVEQKERQERPAPAFTTSTLQQQAIYRLHFHAKKTMMVAQRLYEGVELGPDGAVALITYMRTDSTRISEDALKAVRGMIKDKYGDPYLPATANRQAAGKGAQDAHEAIRPTDLTYTPEKVAPYLPSEQLRLYTLIYNRFVASQMTPAVFAVTSVEVHAEKGVFRASGRTMKFDGYRRVMPPSGKQEDVLLPDVKEKDALKLLKLDPTQHFTEPPPRYNEASLVKTLEKEGIGRPSTYASIITKIQEREYVALKERRFYATEMGMKVNDLLVEHFPKVMDLTFTRQMEEELDHIEDKKYQRNQVLNEFYEPFEQALKVAQTKMMADAEKCPECGAALTQKFSRIGRFYGCSRYPDCKYIKKKGDESGQPREPAKPTEFTCPACGKQMLQRMGKRGSFLGCSGYPDCKTTMTLDAEGKPQLTARPTEHSCEKCGKPMVLREGSRGPFLACTGYPKCRNAKDVDKDGNPLAPIDTGEVCVKCGAPMLVRKSWRGPFLGCSAYPRCRSTKKVSPELEAKLKDILPPMPKKAKLEVEISETCPQCGAAMKVRNARGNYFLGCTKYPKCRGTREPSPETLEKIRDQLDGAGAGGGVGK